MYVCLSSRRNFIDCQPKELKCILLCILMQKRCISFTSFFYIRKYLELLITMVTRTKALFFSFFWVTNKRLTLIH